MAATYDPTLITDKDYVRFVVGDRDLVAPKLQDQEIEAILAEEPNKWLAAARCGEMISRLFGGDVVSKSVGDLSLTFKGSPEDAYVEHIKKLREKGCQELLKRSGGSVFRAL